MHRQLAPHGYLLLGASETTYKLSDDFERVNWTAGPPGTGRYAPSPSAGQADRRHTMEFTRMHSVRS